MIRIDEAWLSTEAMDMRAGMDILLSKVVLVFGAAQPHHAYLFTNARGSRLKILFKMVTGCGCVPGVWPKGRSAGRATLRN